VTLPSLDEFQPAERAAAEGEVLSSGHEDVYGLWDMARSVNSALDGAVQAHVLRLAQAVIFDLLGRGLLELTYGRELQNEDGDPVPADRWESVLADLASWDPYARGEDEPYYTVTATPEGIQAYYRYPHEPGVGG